MQLFDCNHKLQLVADQIVSALRRKGKGKGLKFFLNAKCYGGFKYSSENSADIDERGRKVVQVSDGVVLLKNAVDVQRRDLFNEISTLTITPLAECPHLEIVAAEDLSIEEEKAQLKAEKLATERRRAENEIVARKRGDEKKRKRAERITAEVEAAARQPPCDDHHEDDEMSEDSIIMLEDSDGHVEDEEMDDDAIALEICLEAERVRQVLESVDAYHKAKRTCLEQDKNDGKTVDECSLGLTFFYDGGVNYKRSTASMWPLVTSVINCNPSNRTKLGIEGGLLNDQLAMAADDLDTRKQFQWRHVTHKEYCREGQKSEPQW
jgi:hypothetical protein